jgi:hypothetical protein
MQYRKAARSCRETLVGKKPPASTRRP